MKQQTKKYETFEDWFLEFENYSQRADRFYESLDSFKSDAGKGENMMVWLKAAFESARLVNDLTIEYSEEYDAYYYVETNEWIEPRCSDPSCHYCINRPSKPLL